MNLPPLSHPSRSLQILKIILYILAGIVLVLGLIGGISLMSSAPAMVANVLIPLQIIGADAIYNMIAPMLTGWLTNLGILIIFISIVLSALLYAIGRLVGHTANLEARLVRLEAGPVKTA